MVDSERQIGSLGCQGGRLSLAGTVSDQLKFILRYAILAPSGPNTQPWKLALKDNEVSLIADFIKVPSVDPTDRTLFISHGCLLAKS